MLPLQSQQLSNATKYLQLLQILIEKTNDYTASNSNLSRVYDSLKLSSPQGIFSLIEQALLNSTNSFIESHKKQKEAIDKTRIANEEMFFWLNKAGYEQVSTLEEVNKVQEENSRIVSEANNLSSEFIQLETEKTKILAGGTEISLRILEINNRQNEIRAIENPLIKEAIDLKTKETEATEKLADALVRLENLSGKSRKSAKKAIERGELSFGPTGELIRGGAGRAATAEEIARNIPRSVTVNDFILTKKGQLLKTNPADTLMGVKHPERTSSSVNINITAYDSREVADKISRILADKFFVSVSG